MSPSIRGHYAKMILEDHHRTLLGNKSTYAGGLPSPRQGSEHRALGDPPITVGIIGAGAAGLYASLIINSLDDPRITYEIFDANPMRDRKGGGRLYTYKFPNGGLDDYFVRVLAHPLPVKTATEEVATGRRSHAFPRHSMHEASLRLDP